MGHAGQEDSPGMFHPHEQDPGPTVSTNRGPSNRKRSRIRGRSRQNTNYNIPDQTENVTARRPSHPAVALDAFRRHSIHCYQSFPSHLRPPTSSGKPPTRNPKTSRHSSRVSGEHDPTSSGASNAGSASDENSRIGRARYPRFGQYRMSPSPSPTPIPTRKLLVLALIALAEQISLNSISPYLPEMVRQLPGVEPENVGVSVGMIASAFAMAQFVTNFFWGHLSDRVGRKPVILCGTILTAGAFVLWGFASTLWQAVLVQAIMGAVNGNQGVVSTVLGEITDRSNQSAAFAYLPVVYGIGGILGPILGGLLASSRDSKYSLVRRYPYCLPNFASAALLVLDFIICIFFLDESLAEARELPPLTERVRNLFSWLWQFTSALKPTYLKSGRRRNGSRPRLDRPPLNDPTQPLLGANHAIEEESEDDYSDDSDLTGFFTSSKPVPWKQILTPSTIVLLATYSIFNLAMVGYNALYPIFVSSPAPIGRDTPVRDIGLSLGFSGIVTIFFQVMFFARLQDKAGNEWSFKASLGLFASTFFIMPFIGYKSTIGTPLLWTELGAALTLKVVSSITALTCAMILITNCAPNPSNLGSVNGLAQTLSAAGRALGPLTAGGLFTLGTKYKNYHGEWIPWGVFGGIAVIGFIVSFGIRQEAEKSDTNEVDGANDIENSGRV
ncbi:hypothetical protein TWF106_009667 [Orbilia oligospora]|uniref:Major facilitator superfamily (MFS) profile domain-containing protein n=1 Tax=Orbilia oligospora TaxID=2813651 RepID=A0A7C8UJB2_ORBOL|nr:hypothetical protein TWF106_009667 [Orbilia oligospora]